MVAHKSSGSGAWSGTARRLTFAFASLVTLFGVTIAFALVGIVEVHDSLHGVEHSDRRARAALEFGAALRDAHDASANAVEVPGDIEAAIRDRRQAMELAALASARVRDGRLAPVQRVWLEQLESSRTELDAAFTQRIRPALDRGDRDVAQKAQRQALIAVHLAVEASVLLAESFQTSSGDVAAHAELVQHRTILWALILLGVSTLLAVFVGVYVQRSIARPVALLGQGAARLAEGDLATRIAIDTSDEFGELARQFNTMTQALAVNQRQLVQGENLAAIGRLAAGVAHELNNPLGVILGYVRILKTKTDGELAADMAVIEEEAVRCQEIVEGLLEISRPSKAGAALVDLREVCDEVVERLAEAGQLRTVRVDVSGAGTVEGHPAKLRQIVTNLVRNAVEASPPEAEVTMRVWVDAGFTLLEVRDEGPGISPEARLHLFEPFFTTKADGTGLGLAVSQAIAVAHGGRIDVDDTRPGARFTLRCPSQRREVFDA